MLYELDVVDKDKEKIKWKRRKLFKINKQKMKLQRFNL
ncbi:MAG: hypothetical protein EZS28_048508, partial [Streblomastix strix]